MTITTTITGATNLGNDVLQVTGSVNGQDVTAQGWVSATQQHYQAAAYCPGTGAHEISPAPADSSAPAVMCHNLHIITGNAPAPMTQAERSVYYTTLLLEQAVSLGLLTQAEAFPPPNPPDLSF